MNILDVDVEDLKKRFSKTDKLAAMMSLQKELAEKYGLNLPVNLNTKEGQRTIRNLVFCLVEELFEMTNTLKNREWTKTELPVDLNHFFEELSDSLLFFIELMVAVGLSPQECFDLYLKKYKVNLFRQRTQY